MRKLSKSALTLLGLSVVYGMTLPARAQSHVNDASGLSRTPVSAQAQLPTDSEQAIQQLQGWLQLAHSQGLKITPSGAKHSMGGHTSYPGGIALSMLGLKQMRFHPERESVTVGAGVIWSDLIAYLRPLGQTVSIMQSNNVFSVGGSLSVNCHGWQHNRPPIASSVRQMKILLANGDVILASRTQNAELFRHVLGGYGQFGLILEAELDVVPDARYTLQSFKVPAEDYVAAYERHVNQFEKTDSPPGLVYGRLRVDEGRFLEEALLNVFYESPEAVQSKSSLSPRLQYGTQSETHEKTHRDPIAALKHTIFRNSVYSSTGKWMRWELEQRFGQFIGQKYFRRSQLMDQDIDVIENDSDDSRDILHEYFIPRAQVTGFIQDLRQIIPEHEANLLNVTLRNVLPDQDSALPYAREEVFGFVMLFNQRLPHVDEKAEAQMQALTQALIEAALQRGGSYYLPYRLHATQAQFEQAYPMAQDFQKIKRKYDPTGLFANQWSQKYFPAESHLK